MLFFLFCLPLSSWIPRAFFFLARTQKLTRRTVNLRVAGRQAAARKKVALVHTLSSSEPAVIASSSAARKAQRENPTTEEMAYGTNVNSVYYSVAGKLGPAVFVDGHIFRPAAPRIEQVRVYRNGTHTCVLVLILFVTCACAIRCLKHHITKQTLIRSPAGSPHGHPNSV